MAELCCQRRGLLVEANNSARLSAQGIKWLHCPQSSRRVFVDQCSGNQAMVNVDAAVSTFSGIVKATNVIADAFVLSPGYSPGVGNLL